MRAFRGTLCRQPTADELQDCRVFLKRQTELLKNDSRPVEQLAVPQPVPEAVDPHRAAAVTDLCLALLNCNEFVYVE